MEVELIGKGLDVKNQYTEFVPFHAIRCLKLERFPSDFEEFQQKLDLITNGMKQVIVLGDGELLNAASYKKLLEEKKRMTLFFYSHL
jgi:hypothetical protein